MKELMESVDNFISAVREWNMIVAIDYLEYDAWEDACADVYGGNALTREQFSDFSLWLYPET
jgi:hypothetical protein